MKKLVAVAVSCIAFVSLGACGASSKKASTSKETTSTVGASASANANVAAADLLKYCDYSKAAQAFSVSNPASLTDPGSLKTQLTSLKTTADAYVNVAPSEIKGDVRVYIDDFLKPVITAFENANYDFTKLNASAFTSLNSAQVQTALKNIANYYAAHCNK
ncbi:MAG: hypothetical protein JO054_14950 [Actinobacteria bacterium]|nr:hypothetical protein [Actinomycetota bacterium]MBV9255528.1 hypothetical protein [Actinomycetota bacterium]